MARGKVATCFWFDQNAEDAARFYISLLPDSRIDGVIKSPDGNVLVVEFTLAGTPYQALNGGPHFTLSEAASISVLTKDQAETDRLWEYPDCGWRGGIAMRMGQGPFRPVMADRAPQGDGIAERI